MRFRKSYFGALAISFVVFCCAGVIALFIAIKIPGSAIAEQFRYLQSNHYSPAVYASYRYEMNAQKVAVLDVRITLATMAVAGLAFGLKMSGRARLLETVFYSAISALILAGITLAFDWYATVTIERASLATSGYGPNTRADWHYFLVTAGTVVLYAGVYAAGSVAGYLVRRQLAPPSASPKGHKPSKRRVASTAP